MVGSLVLCSGSGPGNALRERRQPTDPLERQFGIVRQDVVPPAGQIPFIETDCNLSLFVWLGGILRNTQFACECERCDECTRD